MVCDGGVRGRVTSFFKRKRTFDADRYQNFVMGSVAALTMSEVAVHMLLKKSADAGEVTPRINDIVFTSISALECLLAPLLCWLGYRRRTTLLGGWLLVSAIFTIPLVFLTYDKVDANGAELCNSPLRVSTSRTGRILPIFRVVMLILMGVTTAFARMCAMVHGTVCLDEHKPAFLARYLGTILAFRVLLLLSGKDALYDLLENNMRLQIVLLCLPLVVKAVVIFICFPASALVGRNIEDKRTGLGFFSSLGRVLSSKLALVHIGSCAILVTAMWGAGLYDPDVIKTKFHVVRPMDSFSGLANTLLMSGITFIVTIVGYHFSGPVMEEFDKLMAVRRSFFYTLFSGVMIVVLTVINCNVGSIQGLNETRYGQPICSSGCGCAAPYNEFAPVCVLDNMTTYYSPCHAGCTTQLDINNVTILSNCACSVTRGRATLGSCSVGECAGVYNFHRVFFVGFISLTVLAVLMHLLIVLRSVDVRDKSTALGVAVSFISLVAFVGGHLVFMAIGQQTCAWWEGGRCQLQNSLFPKAIGFSCAILIGISAAVNLVSWIIMKKRHRVED